MKQILILLAGIAVMAGCHPGTTVLTGPNGQKIEVDQNGKGSMTVTDDKGNKSSIGTDNVSEADLGVPYYPGSTQKENGNLKSETGDESDATNMRITTDAPQKVVDFYKDALTKAGYTVSGDMVMDNLGTVTGKKTDADVISVTYTHDKDKNENMVMVNHILKKGGAASSASPSAPAPSSS